MAGKGRQGGVRKPATKMPHLRKKLAKLTAQTKFTGKPHK